MLEVGQCRLTLELGAGEGPQLAEVGHCPFPTGVVPVNFMRRVKAHAGDELPSASERPERVENLFLVP